MRKINIHKRIALVRQSKGLTIEQVSKAINKTTYDRIETGKLDLKFSELLKVCDVLNIDIADLVSDELIIKYSE